MNYVKLHLSEVCGMVGKVLQKHLNVTVMMNCSTFTHAVSESINRMDSHPKSRSPQNLRAKVESTASLPRPRSSPAPR